MSNLSYAKAFAPAHITGFFQIFNNGSTGAGINTSDGAVTEVEVIHDSSRNVFVEINGEPSSAPVSRRVLSFYENLLKDCSVRIRHHIYFPIGYGLGMSGAGAFSLSLALNSALKSGFSYKKCMDISRDAEISEGTGLGDVVAQQFSGLIYGLPPYPSFTVRQIFTKPLWVVCAFFEPIETSAIIRDEDWRKKINIAGEKCMYRISNNPSLSQYISSAREFTFETGLPSADLSRVLLEVPESSMAMLGQTAYVITENIGEAVKKLSAYSDRIQVSALGTFGATEVLDKRRDLV